MTRAAAAAIAPGLAQVGAVGADALDHERRMREREATDVDQGERLVALERIDARLRRLERACYAAAPLMAVVTEILHELGFVAKVLRAIAGH